MVADLVGLAVASPAVALVRAAVVAAVNQAVRVDLAAVVAVASPAVALAQAAVVAAVNQAARVDPAAVVAVASPAARVDLAAVASRAVASPAVGPALAVVVARLAPRALLVERLTLHRPGTAPQVEPPRVPRAQVAAQRAVASLNPEDHEAPAAVQAGRILGSRSPSPRKRTEPRRRSEWAQATTVFCWDWASHLSGQPQLGSPSWRR